MQGLKRWCVLLGVIVLLMAALFTAPGFTFPASDIRPSSGGNEDNGDDSPGLTPQEIIDFLEELLFGEEPSDDGGGEGTAPGEGESEEPNQGEDPSEGEVPDLPVEEPDDQVAPPNEEPVPGEDSADADNPHKREKDDVPAATDPAEASHEDPEEPPVEAGSISGCKYLDANRNGCRDAGEPGIAGVGIHLEKGCRDWRAVTAEDGTYAFTGLEPGTYEVEVIEKTLPKGHFHTTDPDEVVCLKPGHMHRSVDFGNGVCDEEPELGSISGRKWRDGDANGVYSFRDCPMAGVEIELWNEDELIDTRISSDTACDKGSYCFEDLEPGTYTVREVSPAGYYPTNPPSGEWTIELAAGEKRGCVNFLNARSLSISGTKWEWRDENGDGVAQDGEKYPLEGLTIQLSSACPCSPGPLQAVTGADGGYIFERLEPGIYTVTELVPDGWYAVAPANASHIVELLCDYDQSGIDFVNARRPSISGTKWEWVDDAGNSEVDAGELYPVQGVEIRLLQNGVEVRPSVFTAVDGSYSFAGLEPGTYTASEVLQQGWYAIDPAGGTQQVKVAAGVDASGVDFLNSQVEVAGEVVTPVAPATATQAGELPQTGMNQVPLILAAAALMLLGLLLLALGIVRRIGA